MNVHVLSAEQEHRVHILRWCSVACCCVPLQDQLSEGAKSTFAATHILPEGLGGRNGGSHMSYLEAFLKKVGQ
jgi:hypothetical protein